MNTKLPTRVDDLEIGDKIYVGQRKIAEVAEINPEFGGFTVRVVGGAIYWYRANKRLQKQIVIDESLPLSCTTSCPQGHERYKFSRSNDEGFTFYCVKCAWE